MATLTLDKFSGGNPDGWIFRAERYFTFLGFSEEHWLSLLYIYLEGDALAWFEWLYRNKQFFDWKHFTEKFAVHFQKQTLVSPRNRQADSQLDRNVLVNFMLQFQCQLEVVKEAMSACSMKLTAAQEFTVVDSASEAQREPALPVKAKEVIDSEIESYLVEAKSFSMTNSEVSIEIFENPLDKVFDKSPQRGATDSVDVINSNYSSKLTELQVLNESPQQVSSTVLSSVVPKTLKSEMLLRQVTQELSETSRLTDITQPWVSVTKEDDYLKIIANKVFDNTAQRNDPPDKVDDRDVADPFKEYLTEIGAKVFKEVPYQFKHNLVFVKMSTRKVFAAIWPHHRIVCLQYDFGSHSWVDTGQEGVLLMPWNFRGHIDTQFGRIILTIGVMARSSFAKASNKEDCILAPRQVEEYSGISFPFDPGLRLIHDHFESSWLDNERGVFDDIIARKLFVAITLNEDKPIGTVSKSACETKILSLPKLILSTSSDTQSREVSEVKSDSVFFDWVREFNLDIMPFNTWIQLCLNFEKIRVASSLYYQMPNNGAFPYCVLTANVTTQHLLLHFPFDPGLPTLVMLIEFTKLFIEPSLSNRAVATARHILVEVFSLSWYFYPYDQVLHKEGMLQDFERPRISGNYSDFFDRALVLVGVTIGILPLVVSQAGVLHVYVIKTSGMVGYARKLLSGRLFVDERIISIKGKGGLLKITPLAALIFQIREDSAVSMMLTTSVFSSPKVLYSALEPSHDNLSVHQLAGNVTECRVIYNKPLYDIYFRTLFMDKMSTKEVDNSTGVYSKEMAAKENWKAESIADFIHIVISYLMQFSCIDEVFLQAGGFKKVAAIVCEFIVYLKLENCNCIHGLVDMQVSCCKRVNKGHVWLLFLQELKALTSLQYGDYYRNCRDPKALVNYLESVRLLGLRGLNNYKYLCFMNLLLLKLPPTYILRNHFLSVEHNYKVLLLYRDKEMDSLWMHGSACWTGLTLWLDNLNSFPFLKSNLEDKVLIEGRSIVMNGPEGVLVNGPVDRSLWLQQPKTSSSGYVWDPG